MKKRIPVIDDKKRTGQQKEHVRPPETGSTGLIGNSSAIRAIATIAQKIAKSVDTPCLILGESGTGKSILAKGIHSLANGHRPFVSINCGALARDLVESELFGYEKAAFTGANPMGKRGLFELSNSGTLFLDEIGAMPLSAQAKLLGVLENRCFFKVGGTREIAVQSRIIAATNIDMATALGEGRFRNDLYYRLGVISITIPPLRQRQDDIIILANYFIDFFNKKFQKNFTRISRQAKHLMLAYHWPGNVRELKNIIERIILLEKGDTIVPPHLPFLASPAPSDEMNYNTVTRELIQKALMLSQGNIVAASQLLKLPVHKLRYRIKKLNLTTAPTQKHPSSEKPVSA
jgi:transcriptional regulator with PAS, ATPase and Fis domain